MIGNNGVASEQGREVQHPVNINSCIWGDELDKKKSNDSIRIGFQNINGFITNNDGHKAESIRDFLQEYNLDVFGMAEMNTNWRLLPKRMSFYELSRGWFEHQHVTTAYNSRDRFCKQHQPGGTALFCKDEMGLRQISSGHDSRNLGRWSWMLFRGKDQIKLRVLSVYVPIVSRLAGSKKVYNQQQKALLAMGIKKSVMSCFWDDFWEFIDDCIEGGEQLIISGDWNVDVRKAQFLEPFQRRNLLPAVTGKHGTSGPETASRGSVPIDEIMVSSTLQIQAAGYLPHASSLGDHRPIWLEVSKDSALGSKLPPIPSFQARRLKCRDPRIVQKYNDLLESYLDKHGVYPRLADLFATYSTPLPPHQIAEYEKLDKIIERGMMWAERKCRKLFMGHVGWFPALKRIRRMIRYIKASLSRLAGCKVSARFLIRLSKSLKFSTEGMTEVELCSKLNSAFKTYKHLKSRHKQLRKTFLEDLAEALEKAGKGKKAKIVSNLLRTEEQRDMFRRLRRINTGDSNLGTTFITTTDAQGNKIDITDKSAMEQVIISENRQKYHQTESTCPFLHPPLSTDLGQCGEGPKVQEVIDGTYQVPPEVDTYTRDYIHQCKQSATCPSTSMPRTPSDFKDSWKKMDERTSSRHLHFGHFKAACQRDINIMTHYIMAEIPFRTGYSPDRWRTTTNVMILKKAGLYDVQKLRTIVLYDAAFNHNNKFFGRSMMKHATDNGLISPEQYSRPGRKAIDHALNRRLLFDITRYQKSSLAMTSCDLKSCYDRIAHTPALLAALGYGIDGRPLQSMFTTIQNTKYVTRTAYGDSQATFGGLEEGFIAKPQGTGQGNGSGPQIWAVVSSRMFEVLRKRGHTTSHVTPISQQDLQLSGFAYVDDSDIIASSGINNNPDLTIELMQATIDCWEGVAKSTGGALEPSKSWWYLVFFEWENGLPRYGKSDDLVLQDTLTVRDKNNQRGPLQHLESDTAMEMLGVFLAPDGNNTAQIKKMKDKSTKLGEAIRTGHITKSEAWTSLTLMALKSLEYPLPALTLSEQDCTSIMWPLLRNFLPKAGVNRTMKRDVVYGPLESQGLNLRNIYLSQGISHISDIIEHVWKGTITGHFITMSLELLRLELGINGSIFLKNIAMFEKALLTTSWIRHSWSFTSQYNITWDEHTVDIPPRRVNDIPIMEKLYQDRLIPASSKWQSINRCRMYLRVFFLSDITSGDGLFITSSAYWGRRSLSNTRDHINWPRWERPKTSDWTAWRKYLSLSFIGNNTQRKLLRPLGKWLHRSLDNWQWFVSSLDEKYLYQREADSWKLYRRIGRSQLVKRFLDVPSSTAHLQPDDLIPLIPTTVRTGHKCIITEGISVVSTEIEPPLSTFMPSLSDTAFETWLFVSIKMSENIYPLLHDLQYGNVIAVSDGSYKESSGLGSAAWTIESLDGQSYISGTSISPGPLSIQNSYRSELVGLLAIVTKIQQLCLRFHIRHGSCVIACDGFEALRKSIHGNLEWISPSSKQADILSAIIKTVSITPVTYSPRHVKGHQDSHTSFSQLDRLSQMNVRMDSAAKHQLSLMSVSEYNLIDYPLHPFSFSAPRIHQHCIYHCLPNDLYNAITSHQLHTYWQVKGRYEDSSLSMICWKSQTKAMHLVSGSRRRFLSKWISGVIGTGKNMKRWKLRPHSNCPFCRQTDEDTSHVLTCHSDDSQAQWESNLRKYLFTLRKTDTCVYLTVAIAYELRSFRFQRSSPSITCYPSTLRSVIMDQRRIGWHRFMEGLWARSMITYQHNYLEHKKKRRTGLVWAHKAIRHTWDFLAAIWDDRNKRLHDTDVIKELEGLPILLRAIEGEWDIGLHRLPASDFYSMFLGSFNSLKKKNIDSLITWLSIIRNGRFLHKDPSLIHDEFSIDASLNDWLGLAYIIKDGTIVHKY